MSTSQVPSKRISLDELATRIHQTLASNQLVPSPEHVRAMLAQALGYSDNGVRAQEEWDEIESPPMEEHLCSELVQALPKYEEYMASSLTALQYARAGSPCAMQNLIHVVHNMKELLRSLEKDTGTATFLLYKIEEEVKKVADPTLLPNTSVLNRLDRFLERLKENMDPVFFPHKTHECRPIPEGLLPRNATLVGDWSLLENALRLLNDDVKTGGKNYENYKSVLLLCDWWNKNAPEDSRHAGCFLISQLNSLGNSLSYLGYDECPSSQIEDFSQNGGYALFEKPGESVIAITFVRGRKHNKYIDCSTHVYFADGSLLWDIGCPLSEVNEAYYSIAGLKALAEK